MYAKNTSQALILHIFNQAEKCEHHESKEKKQLNKLVSFKLLSCYFAQKLYVSSYVRCCLKPCKIMPGLRTGI